MFTSFLIQVIRRTVKSGKRVLVVAHANTIRSLVKVIDSIPEGEVQHLRIPNGIPLVYVLDSDMQPVDMEDDIGFQANYLVSTRNHVKVLHEYHYISAPLCYMGLCDVDDGV